MTRDPIPYGSDRKAQMGDYSERHYGRNSWKLTREKVIVLHLTAGNSYKSAWNTFASNAPNRDELPGVCTHFIVAKDGTIYKLVSLRIRCRHAIGLNHVSIGVEMVQNANNGSREAAQSILARKKQIRSAVALVAWLLDRYDIRMGNVIGHAMANDSRFFKDLQGWRNDHTDWQWPEVKEFRQRVKATS